VFKIRKIKDKLSLKIILIIAISFNLLLIVNFILLSVKSEKIFESNSLFSLLLGGNWQPLGGEFGLKYFIAGTLFVTFLSIMLAAPLGILCSIFLAEYAPKKISVLSKSIIDIFAGIPSVVYGIWGVICIVPAVAGVAHKLFGLNITGYSLLSASVVLSIMIFPIITNIVIELIEFVPQELREVSYSLGATRWQTVKHVVIRKIYPGIIAAIILGLSRAFGETMAVMMVAGNVAAMPRNVFDPVYTLSALIANNYGEMMSIPLYDSAVMFVSLVLLVTVVLFNSIARIIIHRIMKNGIK